MRRDFRAKVDGNEFKVVGQLKYLGAIINEACSRIEIIWRPAETMATVAWLKSAWTQRSDISLLNLYVRLRTYEQRHYMKESRHIRNERLQNHPWLLLRRSLHKWCSVRCNQRRKGHVGKSHNQCQKEKVEMVRTHYQSFDFFYYHPFKVSP